MNKFFSKQSLIAAAVLAVSVASTAAHADDFSGAFIGLKAGDNSAHSTGDYATDRKNAASAGVEAGYNWKVYGQIVGVSAFYDYNDSVNHSASNGSTAKYGSQVSGVDLVLGTPIQQWLIYAKLGDAYVSGTDAAKSLDRNAFHGGLGLSYAVAPQLSVGTEWTDERASKNGTKLDNDNFAVTVTYRFSGFGG